MLPVAAWARAGPLRPSQWLEHGFPIRSSMSTAGTVNVPPIVVVGAGLLGAATAYHLAAAGLPAVVLEREQIGAGATARSAGLMIQVSASAEKTAMVQQTLKDAEDLEALFGEGTCGLRRDGSLRVAVAPARVAELVRHAHTRPWSCRADLAITQCTQSGHQQPPSLPSVHPNFQEAEAELAVSAGVGVEWLSPAAAKERVPWLDAPAGARICYVPSDGVVDPVWTTTLPLRWWWW